MPEIKIKHVVSFSSEDKIHRAENILKPETYRKWKCATPGEKNASIVLQFEKALQIHSIDIGNESSAFVEVLVGRSSDMVKEYQVLLVASSFMSPLESRNDTHNNRVRMFGPDKLAQNLKNEKWDCVQVVCTQPFNKNITYGLTFIKFHSPPEKPSETPKEKEMQKAPARLGAFKLKCDDDEDDNSTLPSIGSWLERKNKKINESVKTFSSESPSYAAAILASNSPSSSGALINPLKRKNDSNDQPGMHPTNKEITMAVNKKKIDYIDDIESDNLPPFSSSTNANVGTKNEVFSKPQKSNDNIIMSKQGKKNVGKPFRKIMEGVVIVISGFVNPLRGEIRDKALEMGAKYRGDWDRTCTHLICAFVNTPKYTQVKSKGGKVVTKDWILDCHKKRALLPWRNYMLGTDSENSSEESDSEDESMEEEQEMETTRETNAPKVSKNRNPKLQARNEVASHSLKIQEKASVEDISSKELRTNGLQIQSDSETEDEDAILDYLANTDVESGSGGDTEDEIRKVENEAKTKAQKPKKRKDESSECEVDDDSPALLPFIPDTQNLPLPDLPNFFKKRHFYLYGDFSAQKHHDLQRYITAYNGVVDDYMSENTKYVVTESKWDENFDEALSENEDLIFVKPEWVFKCQDAQKLVPYQPFIIIPKS